MSNMRFIINDMEWEIKGLYFDDFYNQRKNSQLKDRTEFDEHGMIFGYTELAQHKIYLNLEQCHDELIKTLIHELGHCWLWSYGASYTSYSEDALCDTISASFDFINEIVDRWKRKECYCDLKVVEKVE